MQSLRVLFCVFVMWTVDFSWGAPPAPPLITEPAVDGQVVNPSDVHMETAPFSDPDAGDQHFCTDWEIWSISPPALAWQTSCITGLESVHSHLGDGTFVGAHAGRTELFYDTDYRLRVRHRDDSPAAEWSDYSERLFSTGPQTEIFPLEADDILDAPVPQWTDPQGMPVIAPASSSPPFLRIETGSGGLLLEFRAFDGTTNVLINPAILPDHEPVRLRVSAGNLPVPWVLPETDVTFRDHEGDDHILYLPSINVSAGSEEQFWVAANGATYDALASDVVPDFTDLARGVPVPWEVLQPGYKVEVVASGFQLPVNIAFVPNPGPNPGDPYYYVTELYGTIKVVTRDGTVSDYASNLLNFVPTGNFPGSGEQGVTGIVVEPNGDVLASMLYDAGGPHYPKLVRFSSLDGGVTAATETILLDMVGETQGQSHQVSNVTLGPDGKIYLHMGDGFVAATGQNLDSFRGKVLRINDDGTAPADNPFYDAANGISARDYVYAYGLRNPFGGAWRAADGVHYQVENGPSVDRLSKILAGQNYLWNGSNGSMFNFAIHNWNPSTGPTNIAFVEPTLFAGSGFPAEKFDHAFIAESGPTWATGPQSNGKMIREYVLDAAGNLSQGPTDFVRYTGTGKATAVGLAAGPDGLYFTDLYKDQDYQAPIDVGANVLRVRFVGAADFTVDVDEGMAPLTVQFTDSSNVVNPTAWSWDFGDGNQSTDQNPMHTYTQDGIYDVSLGVTGASGLVVELKSGFVRVGDFPSLALIGSSIPPTAADEGVAEFLHAQGYEVDHFDDEPMNRPSASQLAQDYDLVLVSSTVLSANIDAEFRNEPVPVIFWEQALLPAPRESMASGGLVVGGTTTISITDNSHPVTQGLALGSHLLYATPSNMSVATSPLGAGATALAIRAGAPAEAALVVAEAGAPLLGGHVAAARRVFMFLEDSSWLAVTSVGETLLSQAVDWCLGGAGGVEFRRGDCNGDNNLDISDPIVLLDVVFGQSGAPTCPDACDGNDDGTLDVSDAVTLLSVLFGSGGPLPEPQFCGPDPTADVLDCVTSLCP